MKHNISDYYISCTGELCITFPSTANEPPELCRVDGVWNETWFMYTQIF